MTAPANPDRRIVTVWSDLASPNATMALHTLHARAAERRIPLLIDHRSYPLELLESRPTLKEVVDGEVALIAARHPELGWQQWPGPDHRYPVTTLLAMEAVQAAKSPEAGGLRGSDQLDAALRRAFLVEGRCISLFNVVVEAAQECPLLDIDALVEAMAGGVGRERVFTQWGTAARRRVAGSPHLFAGTIDVVEPGDAVEWPAGPGNGTPRLRSGGTAWADELLDVL